MSSSDFFLSLANKAHEGLVTLAHLVWVWEHKAWQWSGLDRFWMIFWDFLDVHPLAALGLGGMFLSIGQAKNWLTQSLGCGL